MKEKETPSLSSPQMLYKVSHLLKNPIDEHQEMHPPIEPEAIELEASLEERGEADESVVLEAGPKPRTERIDGEPDDGTRQAVKRASLLSTFEERAPPCSAQFGCTVPADREDANASGVPEATTTPTPKTVVFEPDDDVSQAAMKDSLLPAERSLTNEERPPCSSTQPSRTVPAVQEDAAKNPYEKPITRKSGMNSDNNEKDDPSQEIKTINRGEYKWKLHCFTTPQAKDQARTTRPRTDRRTDGGRNVYVAWSKAHRAARSGRAVEMLQEPAISISTAKSPRLIWDPGLESNQTIRSSHRRRPTPDDSEYQERACSSGRIRT